MGILQTNLGWGRIIQWIMFSNKISRHISLFSFSYFLPILSVDCLTVVVIKDLELTPVATPQCLKYGAHFLQYDRYIKINILMTR